MLDFSSHFSPFRRAAPITEEAARDLVQEFFEFRKLILSIDPPDDDDLDTSLNATTTMAAAAAAGDLGDAASTTGGGMSRQLLYKAVYLSCQTWRIIFSPFVSTLDTVIRLPAGRSLVPQSHNRSSDEEDDSADSDVSLIALA